MWQALYEELQPQGLEVVTVALDVDPERARPWIEAAQPMHPSLVDTQHVVDELYGIVNVPNSVWIDEEGTIVRPAEVAHVQRRSEAGREKLLAQIPEDKRADFAALLDEARKLNNECETYTAMLRDWAANGAASRYALPPDEVLARAAGRLPAVAEAAARFELGCRLRELGAIEAAQRQWREAHRLQPDNWTYKRQAWELLDPGRQGRTDVYDGSWLDDVRVSGAESYYPLLRP